MHWSINIIILQLFGQVLSDLQMSCFVKDWWKCNEYNNNTKRVLENNYSVIEADRIKSSITITCSNKKKLSYSDCPWNEHIQNRNSILGINQVESIIIINSPYKRQLQEKDLSNLECVKILEISGTKNLELINESFKGISKLTKLSLRNNEIKKIPNGVFKLLTCLEELDLRQNQISEISSDLFYNIPLKQLNLGGNKLTTLNLNISSLKFLDVSENKLESIIINNLNKLVNLSLNPNFLLKMQNEPFKNTSIESITFNFGHFTIPNEFLTNLVHLRNVCLEALNLIEIPENMIWNSSNITDLSLASNSLKQLPEKFFRDAKKIKVLNLSHNKIENINYQTMKPLENLEKLDLSNNSIVEIKSASLNLSKLKILILCDNSITNLEPNDLFSENLSCIETIDLSRNRITHYDQKWSNLINLKIINLRENKISLLTIEDNWFVSRIEEFNFVGNPLKQINVKLTDGQKNIKHRKIHLSSNEFVCDCHNYEFAKFINQVKSNITHKELEINVNLYCNGVKNFSEINTDRLTCDWENYNNSDKINNCSSGCVCTYRPQDNSALMNCSNKYLNKAPEQIISSQNISYTELDLSNNLITELPDYNQFNIRKLNISHNNLTTINLTELPINLEELYMEHNHLGKISETNLTHVLTRLKHITMRNNSWDCDCDRGKNTFSFFMKHISKIDDSNNIVCSHSLSSPNTLLVHNIEICSNKTYGNDTYANDYIKLPVIIIIAMVIIFYIFSLLFALFKSYKTEIILWLYAHGITWPFSEEFLDQDKKYDAFVSYSHMDIELINKHLVPGLEKGDKPFKLCLHNRDWEVGDWIPAQIARSVDESRRTIIVLSKNYLDSVWARTEFRAAYSSALKERRSRLIVILYGEISVEDLDTEMKAYLSMNTYIRWGDNWFWEKLRYALPRRPVTAMSPDIEMLVPDKLNSPKLI